MYDAVPGGVDGGGGDSDINKNAKSALVEQKGESHPIVQYIRELLDNREWRIIFYCALIMLSIFPIFVDSVDLFGGGADQYVGNEFCVSYRECSLALTAFVLMLIGIIIILQTTLFSTYHSNYNTYKNIAVFLLFVGNTLLLIAIVITTFSTTLIPSIECFDYSSTRQQRNYCHLQYFGTNILYPLIIYCAIMDFSNIWDETQNVKYLINRLIWFSLSLFVSSMCTVINLIGNNDIYQRHVLANTSYVTCTIGYSLVIFVSISSLLIQCSCLKNWHTERTFARMLGFMLLIAVLLIQSRTFADLFVFCCMCLIMAADIQVIKET